MRQNAAGTMETHRNLSACFIRFVLCQLQMVCSAWVVIIALFAQLND